ncbi:hypothetical protein EX895_003726 [Sporisorium graminicola]|uniref:Uncharacterized protein n=1 Tax=Sporisorium graminicola TaxID=280036 RepID=A0A4V6ETL0_9BASI|nr:hypothetical protein EX895_003726 [Sporisorium graminicola]TKY87049.1 hypothetical protein EX895_003726 [Sporisorium graminicola]
MSSNAVHEYLSLPSSARVDSPKQSEQWIDAMLSGGLSVLGSVSDSIRSKLATAVLTDVATASGMRQGDYLLNARSDVRWNSALRLSALNLLKELSRLPGGSAPLAKPEALRILLQQVDFPKQRVRRSSITASTSTAKTTGSPAATSTASSPTSSNNAATYSLGSIAKSLRRAVNRRGSQRSDRRPSKDKDIPSSDSGGEDYETSADPDWPITDMALRCLNNALFLNEAARLPFSSEDVGGGHVAVALLSRPQDTPADILFLGARLLFFSTLFESPFNKTAVTTLKAVRIEAACVDALVMAMLEKASNRSAASSVLIASGSEAQLNMALSDLLKAHFNICLYYPRIVQAEAKQNQSTGAAAASTSTPPQSKSQRPILGEGFDPELLGMLHPLISVVTMLPLPSPVPLMPPFTHAIADLLNYPVADVKREILGDKRSVSSGSLPTFTAPVSPLSTQAFQSAPPYIARLITFADVMLARYFAAASTNDDGRRVPEDVDAKTVKQKASADGIDLEDTLEPLLLLLRKTAAEDDTLRSTLASILLPADLDRSLAIDRRLDVLGRLVRLMSSVTLSRPARASGELLLSLCNGDAKQMTEVIGYGPCAGFLMNTGLASALPSGVAPADSNGRTVDPITGEYEPTEEEKAMDEINRMTEEEKEAEAERLFVLFDRMNKTGVMQVRHPMAAAHESGRFEEIDAKAEADEKARLEKEDEEAEREVEREMAAHRKRKEEAKVRAHKLVSQQQQQKQQPGSAARTENVK